MCAWRAIEASWTAAVPRLARDLICNEDEIDTLVNLTTLRNTVNVLRREWAQDFGQVGHGNFSVDVAGATFSQVIHDAMGLHVRLGYVYPPQPNLGLGDNEDNRGYEIVWLPDLAEGQPPPWEIPIVWIYHNNDPANGHYEGLRAL